MWAILFVKEGEKETGRPLQVRPCHKRRRRGSGGRENLPTGIPFMVERGDDRKLLEKKRRGEERKGRRGSGGSFCSS